MHTYMLHSVLPFVAFVVRTMKSSHLRPSTTKRENHDWNLFLDTSKRKNTDHRAGKSIFRPPSYRSCFIIIVGCEIMRAYNTIELFSDVKFPLDTTVYSHRVYRRDKLFIKVFHNSAAQSPGTKDVGCGCVIGLRETPKCSRCIIQGGAELPRAK